MRANSDWFTNFERLFTGEPIDVKQNYSCFVSLCSFNMKKQSIKKTKVVLKLKILIADAVAVVNINTLIRDPTQTF